MFENLSDRLERSFKILKGEGKITEINVAETMKDVRRALLDADVMLSSLKKTAAEIAAAIIILRSKAYLALDAFSSIKPFSVSHRR